MTPKQKAFCDYYLEMGNATQAAIKAGYSKKYAGTNADKLLKNTNIAEYMAERQSKLDKKRLLSVEEALALSASIALGEPQLFVYEELDPDTQELIKRELKRYSPRVEERQRSLEHILKAGQAFDKKETVSNQNDLLRKIAEGMDNI